MPHSVDGNVAVTEEPRRYSCRTQKNLDLELLPPQLQVPEGERPSVGNGEESINVGVGTEVPRWDVAMQGPRQLKYFVQTGKFPSSARAKDASEAFQKAADLWGAMGLGISFVATSDAASANFDLNYWDPNDQRNTTLASAFFPSEPNRDVWVYSNALQPEYINDLVPIFAHEIGHILGLRHEFAITGDKKRGLKAEGNGAKLFMDPNPLSVMSYTFPPTIQNTDEKGVKAFYKLQNGYEIGGLLVTDYIPTLRKR